MNEPYDLSHIVSVIWNKEDVYGLLKDTHKETTLSKNSNIPKFSVYVQKPAFLGCA